VYELCETHATPFQELLIPAGIQDYLGQEWLAVRSLFGAVADSESRMPISIDEGTVAEERTQEELTE
jgi:hypothetical protein